MVAVVVAVFFSVDPQNVVEPEFATQHGGHAARNNAGVLRANQTQVFACHAAQVAGVVECTCQKAFVFTQPLRQTILRKPIALALGHEASAMEQLGHWPALGFKVCSSLYRCAVAFDAVGLAHGHGFVVQAVVQGL